MPVRVPFRLCRRRDAVQTDALLLPSADPAAVLAVLAALGGGTLPDLFPVADGFLVLVADGTTRPVPGAIRLRRLREAIYVPVDADLSPVLLPDEAAGMVRDRGLVFLPGGTCLAYDPSTRWRPPLCCCPAEAARRVGAVPGRRTAGRGKLTSLTAPGDGGRSRRSVAAGGDGSATSTRVRRRRRRRVLGGCRWG